jgi:dethiobiotin synthetase
VTQAAGRPRVLFVTGTDTGVGKTVVTAALAATLSAAGRSVAVYKPTQAGLESGLGDIDVVRRLSGVVSVSEGIRLRHPMAPLAAAERENVTLPSVAQHRRTIGRLADSHDVTLVEGAGGLLVALDGERQTLADLAGEVSDARIDSGFVVVCRSGLGTLNHTLLTLEALRRRALALTSLVIGSWPSQPDEIARSNRIELATFAPALDVIPEGAGTLTPAAFAAGAREWLQSLPA